MKQTKFGIKYILWGAAAIALAVGLWLGYDRFLKPSAANDAPTFKTAMVRVGDIKISTEATGSLTAVHDVSLGLGTAGRVAEVAVGIGQTVSKGDLLLRLDDVETRSSVELAEIALRSAELKRLDLSDGATASARSAALANVRAAEAALADLQAGSTEQELAASQATLDAQRASVTTARAALASAQANLARLRAGPDPEDVEIAERRVEQAKNALWGAQAQRDAACGRKDSGGSAAECDLGKANVQKGEEEVRIAEIQLQVARQGPTPSELAAADAQLQSARGQLANAEAQLRQAELSWENLNDGPDAEALAATQARLEQAQEGLAKLSEDSAARDLEAADLAVRQAQVNLDLARDRLARSELRAPFDGIVVELSASAGEQVNTTNPVIRLASTSDLLVEFFVEEEDLGLVDVGTPISASFRALPDAVVPGKVMWVSPVLSEVDGVPAARTLGALDPHPQASQLRLGMEADVEVISALAEDALLVPMDALRPVGDGGYAVFVVGDGGKLQLRPVVIGIQDFANAQVLEGLNRGDVVSTGSVAAD